MKINTLKNLFILLLILTIHSIAYSQSTKLAGIWEGKTSQDNYITITVELENGNPIFKKIRYGIILKGASYSIERIAQYITSANIKDGKFSYSSETYDGNRGIVVQNISGTFDGNILKGNISATLTPAREDGTLVANVTFTLEKKDSIK